jgi:predicted secreted protein with PEFG-CTERM motif
MDYKTYALMAILLASVASVALVGAASAQTTLTVETDADSYTTGDDITVTGQLDTTTINQPLLIQVLDEQGNRDKIDQFNAAADGSYTYTFRAGGTMNSDGTYTVIVSYKGTTSEETTFEFDSTDTGVSWRTFEFEAGGQNYQIQYIITGGSITSVSASSETTSLTIAVSSTADGTLQLRLPREVIDSRDGPDGRTGADEEFVAFADEVPADVTEDEAANTASVRQISIDFEQGTGSIEVVGTYAVPEFGAIAAIILAVAIVGIIVATAKYGKFNFAPRL